jgi:hypothetical protein
MLYILRITFFLVLLKGVAVEDKLSISKYLENIMMKKERNM